MRGKLRLILQLAILLSYGSGLPVVKVGRIAGQFGKPRSSPTEIVDGVELPVYRGDIVNDTAPTRAARTPDVERLRSAYHHASATLNVLRALLQEGFADLEQVHAWNQEFVRRNPAARQHEDVAADIAWALRFMAACGAERTDREHPAGPPLHLARGAAARLGGGADPARRGDRGLVRHQRPHAVGGRQDPETGRRAHRVPVRDREPDRGEDRTGRHARRAAAAV
ncbi:hypothetical protein GCM10018952_37030 [Streptosporangium vulgare]